MSKKASYVIVIALALLAIISSQALTLSDFLSGLVLGVSIVFELIAIVLFAKEIRNDKESEAAE